MVKEKTLFVIGAGASEPYGFPTGRELRKNIIKNFQSDIDGHLVEVKINRSEITKFISRFRESGIYSIDRFLSLQPEFSNIGRLAIAFEILKAEALSNFNDDAKISNDWYSYLYNKMIEEIPSSEESNFLNFSQNKVSFITFNYDRSLDYFINTSFENSFSNFKHMDSTIKELVPFEFYHVYGSAKLPRQTDTNKEPNIPYNFCPNNKFNINLHNKEFIIKHHLKTLANGIRIVDDRIDETIQLEIHKIFQNASRVFFLGFGYADENLRILGLPHTLKGKRAYGTAMGFTYNELRKIIKKVSPDGGYHEIARNGSNGMQKGQVTLLDTDCLTLLREFL